MENKLQTHLSRAKGLGSAKTGYHHWLYQRITGIFLIFFVIWAVLFVKCSSQQQSLSTFIELLKQPYNIIPLIFFSIIIFYHSMLGIRVILEDYVHCRLLRISLIIAAQLFCAITNIALSVTLMYVLFT